ncbi:hypothetical protein EG329_014376 [Mollisiaceae sp. DMI_Dod_QoI]|nr:hypothetical protein EG329_014376 [Helotiales sp. DMI_Dod_QoI]
MSGVELLAVLGIACNVMQCLSFGHEMISLYKKHLESGSADPSVADNAAIFASSSSKLGDSLASAPQPLTKEESELLNVARKSLAAAIELAKELDKIRGNPAKGSILASIRATLRHVRRQRNVERLEKSMLDYQRTLNSGLLYRICSMNQVSNLQSEQSFSKLDSSLQRFIEAYSQGETQISELIIQTKAIGTNIKSELAKALDASEHNHVLRSLKYEGMNERRNMITDHYYGTFQWIFDSQIQHEAFRDHLDQTSASEVDSDFDSEVDSDSDSEESATDELDEELAEDHPRQWDSFSEWLKSENNKVYWISGKAGSGKSTLMKYLVEENPRTNSGLDVWHPRAFIISHFLWSPGNSLQRSIKGILLSMLHNIFLNNSNLLDCMVQDFPDILSKDHHSDWAVPELERLTFRALFDASRATCIFLDGLDEIIPSDGVPMLLEFLSRLEKVPLVKICLSSRPEFIIEKRFANYPKLRLHHLTEQDIRCYVEDYLKKNVFRSATNNAEDVDLEWFLHTVCQKADGVFLWVHLALKSLEEGFGNNDDISDLNHRLDLLPNGLHELFKNMWDRLGENKVIYQEKAAEYFNIALEAHWRGEKDSYSLSILGVMVALDSAIQEEFLERETRPGLDYMRSRCQLTKDHVQAKCAGLLECTTLDLEELPDPPGPPGPYDALLPFLYLQVNFIHRSARDFLLDTEDGRQMLTHDHSTKEDRLVRLLHADLVAGQIFNVAGQKRLGSTYNIGSFLNSIASLRHGLSAARESELLSTTRRIYNNGDIPYFNRITIPLDICQKRPDFHLVLAQSNLFDALRRMLEEFGDRVVSSSINYLLLCILRGHSLQNLSEQNLSLNIDWLLEHRADLHMRGLPLADFPSNDSFTEPGSWTHAAPYSPMMRLVVQLCNAGSSKATALYLINKFLDHSISIQDDSTVFFLQDSALLPSELNIGWPNPGSLGGKLIFKANLSFLLKLALLSIESAAARKWECEESSHELAQALLTRVGQADLLDYFEVIGYTSGTFEEHFEGFNIYKIKGGDDATLVDSLVLEKLRELPMQDPFEYNSEWYHFWIALRDISKGSDTIPMVDLRTSLVQDGFLVSREESWNEITSLRLTS